jgi:ABC-2 type transport system ATP-binding protein
VTAVLEAKRLGKRYRRRWALRDCTLSIPEGHVVGIVGPNGAGKTTLPTLAAGLLTPSSGTIEVLGEPPANDAAQLGRVGFVAQGAPTYPALTSSCLHSLWLGSASGGSAVASLDEISFRGGQWPDFHGTERHRRGVVPIESFDGEPGDQPPRALTGLHSRA